MNPFQRAQFRRMLHKALEDLGADLHTIKRAPKDGNGQPIGEPEAIGALFGVTYRKNQTSAGLKIDLPGIVATADNTRHFAAVATDLFTPQEGDTITLEGRDVVVVLPNVPPGNILYDLILMD